MSLLHDFQRKTIAVKTQLTQQEKEHIWQLMYEKIAGIIRPKDLRYLEEQIPRDPHMQEAFDILEFALREEGRIDLEQLKKDEDWRDIFQQASTRAQAGERTPFFTRPLVEKLAVAAMITGLLLSSAGYYYFSRQQTPPPAKAAALPDRPAENGITLQLADNRTIPLAGGQPVINLGDVQLHNTSQALTFDAKDGHTVHGGQHILTVPAARDYQVTLSDGTEIWLNAASRLQFPFSFNGNSREITLLSGEAYVKAAPDADKPFIIHTAHSTVQVLGTEFNINAYEPDKVSVALVSGAVKMGAGAEAVVIKPGMEALYTNEKGLVTQPFDPREVLSWRSGKHFFVNAPMSEICAILSRNLGITAVIDSGSLAHTKHFSGVVNKHKPVQEFMEDVKTMTDIDYYYDTQGVLHFR